LPRDWEYGKTKIDDQIYSTVLDQPKNEGDNLQQLIEKLDKRKKFGGNIQKEKFTGLMNSISSSKLNKEYDPLWSPDRVNKFK